MEDDITIETIGLHFINTCKACPACGKVDELEVRNFDLMFRDGEVWCKRCNVFVRGFDAG